MSIESLLIDAGLSVEDKQPMCNQFKSYGMFSEAGDKAVAGIVAYAKEYKVRWEGVEDALMNLAQDEDFAEATDTVVRENVYIALGY